MRIEDSEVSDYTDVETTSLRPKKRVRPTPTVPQHGHRVRTLKDGVYQFVDCRNPDCNVLRTHLAERSQRYQRRIRRRLLALNEDAETEALTAYYR